MGQTLEIKMAKADKDDLRRVREFFEMIEEVCEYGTYTKPNDEIEDESVSVDAAILEDLIAKMWGHHGPGVASSWRRVVFGCEILIDNCCDPAADTLEWRPDIREMWERE